MRSGFAVVVVLCALASVATSNLQNEDYFDHLDFHLKQTLRAPLYPVGNMMNEWRFGGHAVTTEDYVRLTSQVKGQSGILWNEAALDTKEGFEVFYDLNVHGDASGGADGMAVWLTAAAVRAPGPLLGGPTLWSGVAVLLDTFDNDGKNNNPRISVLANDGHKTVTAETDGHDAEVAGCLYGFRNIEGGIVLHLKYKNNRLTVAVGQRDTEMDQFFICASDVFVKLPERVHLSLSAQTGGLFDNHDVVGVSCFGDKTEESKQFDREQHEQQIKEHRRSSSRGDAEHRDAKHEEERGSKKDSRRKRVTEPTDEELEKGLPEHHTRPPLAFQFTSIFKDLDGITKKDHPDHETFSADLRLGDISKLKDDGDRYGFLLDSIYNLEEHTDLMIKAFESILSSVDNERFRVQENHHQFAEAFNALYEQVATKKDAEESLQALAGKRSLLKASRKIHKLIDNALEAVEGSDSPIGRLGGLARQMDPTSKDVTERFARNREALASVQHELSALAGAARNSVRWNTLDIVMVVEIVLFVLFVVYQVTRKRQKQSLL